MHTSPHPVLKSVLLIPTPNLFFFFSWFSSTRSSTEIRECGSTWKCRNANWPPNTALPVSIANFFICSLVAFSPFANLFTLRSWKKRAKENKNKGFLPRRGKKQCPWTQATLPPWLLASPESLLLPNLENRVCSRPSSNPLCLAPTTMLRNPYLKKQVPAEDAKHFLKVGKKKLLRHWSWSMHRNLPSSSEASRKGTGWGQSKSKNWSLLNSVASINCYQLASRGKKKGSFHSNWLKTQENLLTALPHPPASASGLGSGLLQWGKKMASLSPTLLVSMVTKKKKIPALR